jgi:hypothetical protein
MHWGVIVEMIGSFFTMFAFGIALALLALARNGARPQLRSLRIVVIGVALLPLAVGIIDILYWGGMFDLAMYSQTRRFVGRLLIGLNTATFAWWLLLTPAKGGR